jgi:uncharacterized protein
MQSADIKVNRRNFLKRATITAGGIVTATTLGTLTAHAAWAREECVADRGRRPRPGRGYGELQRSADQNGDEILALPRGFRYVTFGKTGAMMTDGSATPAVHDGMTCFEMPDDTVRLIRNHELRNPAGNFAFGIAGPEATRYDAKAMGGCVTVDFDLKRKRVVRDFVSINGTYVNCAGGLAYNDVGWLTCEETTAGPAQGFDKTHGFTFLVRKDANAPAPAVALTALGRFAKEAALADNESGIVYQTEDSGDNSGFYRFLPNDPANLLAGGVLQMLAIRGRSNYDTRMNQTLDAELPVEWVTIDNPNPATITAASSCFGQGFARGGARFNRLEGVFRGDDGTMYFVSTSGGNARCGQLWQYLPSFTGGGTLALRFESPSGSVLDSPDNICVTPSGAILFCEDDAGGGPANDTHLLAPGITDVNRLIGLSRTGEPFEFAVNAFSDSEFAGACFSPDGEILFVNIQGGNAVNSGMTCAIWGPWRSGAL